MEINIEKIGMIRPFSNPKNQNINLEIDWSVDYYDTDQNQVKFDCILKSTSSFDLNFKVEGLLNLEKFEEFNYDVCSQIIFDKAFEILMSMFSLTRQSSHILQKSESYNYFGSENVSDTLSN